MKKTTRTAESGSDAERPARWVAAPGGEADVPEGLVGLMRASSSPERLGSAARARVWSRLARGAPRRRPLVALRWSVAAGVLFASAVGVASVTARRWWVARQPAAAVGEATPHDARSRRARPLALAAAPPDELPSTAEASERLAIAAPAVPPSRPLGAAEAPPPPAPAARRHAPKPDPTNQAAAISPPPIVAPPAAGEATSPVVAAPDVGSTVAAAPAIEPAAPSGAAMPTGAPAEAAPPSAFTAEASALGEALTRLRQQHDARGALATLDAYEAQFPRGSLHREATIARVDALLLLGKDADALAALRKLALQPRGRDQELRVIRGELAAPTSCPAAIADFDRVLAEGAAPALVERALHGRASCSARLGDPAAARSDLAEYLRRFPEGRFAAEARRALENDL